MLGFYCSTDKIIRIVFTVTVSVIHCWLCSSTNHNRAVIYALSPPRQVYTASHNLYNWRDVRPTAYVDRTDWLCVSTTVFCKLYDINNDSMTTIMMVRHTVRDEMRAVHLQSRSAIIFLRPKTSWHDAETRGYRLRPSSQLSFRSFYSQVLNTGL